MTLNKALETLIELKGTNWANKATRAQIEIIKEYMGLKDVYVISKKDVYDLILYLLKLDIEIKLYKINRYIGIINDCLWQNCTIDIGMNILREMVLPFGRSVSTCICIYEDSTYSIYSDNPFSTSRILIENNIRMSSKLSLNLYTIFIGEEKIIC